VPSPAALSRAATPKVRALFSDLAWSSLSPTIRPSISVTMIDVLAGRVTDSLASGTFDSQDNRHLSISTIPVNQKGWNDVADLLAMVFHRLDEIKEESGESGESLLPMSVGLLGFESPRLYE
jgi:hypothetical protein